MQYDTIEEYQAFAVALLLHLVVSSCVLSNAPPLLSCSIHPFYSLLRHAHEPVSSLHSFAAFFSPPTLSSSIYSDRTPTLRHAISFALHYTKYSTTRCSTVRYSTYSGHTVDRAGQAKAGTVVQSHINGLILCSIIVLLFSNALMTHF